MTATSTVTERPLNTLHAASRGMVRAFLAIFTSVVLLLIQSAFWSNRVSAWMQAVIVATALLSYFRPHYGLLAVAALAPLGQVGSRTLDSQMRGAEALVLAFLAGALIRGWTLRELRTFPSTRLDTIALIFGFVVTASCLEQIWFTQIQMDFAWPFAQDLLGYASRTYVTSGRGFGMLFRAMLLLEGVALLSYTVRYVKTSAEFGHRLILVLVLGAMATALLTFAAAAGDFAHTRAPGTSVVDFLSRGRWSGHISDVNAAGSYFAMTALLACGIGLTNRKWRWAWLASGVVLLLTMMMTGSRTAVAATGIVAVVFCVRIAVSHFSRAVRAIGAASAVLAVGTALVLVLRTTSATPSEALSIRWAFLQTTAAMLAAEPAFGVGVGQYSLWSAHFAPPSLFELWQPDNAHNNLAQIAGELGLIGLAAFLAVLAISFRDPFARSESSEIRGPLIAGLTAFVLTWLGGHPLLLAEVAYPFWIALGLAAALAPESRAKRSAGMVGVAAVLLIVSIPLRVGAKSAQLDFSRVTYGVSERQIMTSRARFFVPVKESRVVFPLRARNAGDDEPVEIDVFVDGEASGTITLTDRNWRKAPIDLPGASSMRYRQIDLRIKPGALDDVAARRSSVEVGKWEIIPRPHG